MNSVPQELLFALLVAAVLLVQYLMKRLGRRPQPDDALQDEHIPEEQAPEREASIAARWENVPAIPAASFAAAGAAMPRRRHASKSLLGGGQELRRAIVGMTLLGPCRAEAPHQSR